jgi:hypothetical protein
MSINKTNIWILIIGFGLFFGYLYLNNLRRKASDEEVKKLWIERMRTDKKFK